MLTIRKIVEMDRVFDFDRQFRTLLGYVRLANLFHEDNLEEITEIADRFGISVEQLCQYAWLQAYIAELPDSADFNSVEEVAHEFGINCAEFEDYLVLRAEEIAVCKAAISKGCFSWETEESYLSDLMQDADLQG